MKTLLPLCVAPALLLTSAAEVTVFHGPPAGPGDVRVHDELGVQPVLAPPGLQGIRLLPIDAVGRSPLDRLRPNRLELVSSRAGIRHLRLPRGGGALYRFRRDEVGGASFGFFHIDAGGRAELVLERPGTGLAGLDDPFLGPVAVAPRGAAFLAATTVAAGGDLLEVDLAGGGVRDRTAGLAPLDLVPGGLVLTEVLGAAVTAPAGLVRFDRLPGAGAAAVPFPTPPAYFEGSLVASADGTTLALVAGTSAVSADVWAVRSQGPAVCVTAAPGPLSGAGHLPAATAGPTLALSPDGSMCLYRTEGLARDAWLAPTTVALPAAPLGVTLDGSFADTLDTPAEFLFLSSTTVVFLLGEADPLDPTGVENADLFRLRVQSGGGAPLLSLTNVTGTSGDTAPPFLAPGRLDSHAGVYLLPRANRVLAHVDENSGQGSLLLADLSGRNAVTLLPDVKSLEDVAWSAGSLAFDVRRSPALGTRELWTLDPSGVLGLQLSLPDAFAFAGLTHDGAGTFAAFLTQAPTEWLVRTSPGGARLLWPTPLSLGGGLEFTPGGDLASSVDLGPQRSLVGLWRPSGAVSLLAGGGPAFVLASE